jgi:hypothetical protein
MNHYQYQNYYLYQNVSPMDMLKVINENEELVQDPQLMHYYFHQMMMMELFLVEMKVWFHVLWVIHSKY